MIHYQVQFRGKAVCIRDTEERDVDSIVAYWHQSAPSFLRSLGVDLSKLKSPVETRERFLNSLPDAGPSRPRATLVVAADGELISYANLNIRSSDEAYGHFHILNGGFSARGLAYLLFPAAIQIFFDVLPLRRVLFQTSPENFNINRMLESFGLKPQRVHIDVPDGMARPGAFNFYEIWRDDAKGLIRISHQEIGHGSSRTGR